MNSRDLNGMMGSPAPRSAARLQAANHAALDAFADFVSELNKTSSLFDDPVRFQVL